MTADRAARLVGRWARWYTRDLDRRVAERRIAEIEADLHDQVAHDRAAGLGDARIGAAIVSRMTRGMADDLAWRGQQPRAIADRPPNPGGPMNDPKTTYRLALVAALAAGLFLLWGVAAMGVIGAEGDPFDRLYFAVLAVGIGGALLARLEPRGMARALLAMAVAQALVTVAALVAGKHQSPVSSIAEIVGLNGLFIGLFLGAAWLFERSARRSPAG